jgi:hypothetical protein
MKRFVTRALIVVAAIFGIVFAQVAPASADVPVDPSNKLVSNLAELWTKVLQTPASQNPVTNPDASPCWDLGNRTVAPFFGGNDFTCTVKAGTKIFVAGYSAECSDIRDANNNPLDDHPAGMNPPYTEEQLRTCAEDLVRERASNITVTLDGKSLRRTDVGTPLLNIVLPDGNIFGAPTDRTYHSVAQGNFVVLLGPLTPGTHTIFIDHVPGGSATTTIIVEGPPPA